MKTIKKVFCNEPHLYIMLIKHEPCLIPTPQSLSNDTSHAWFDKEPNCNLRVSENSYCCHMMHHYHMCQLIFHITSNLHQVYMIQILIVITYFLQQEYSFTGQQKTLSTCISLSSYPVYLIAVLASTQLWSLALSNTTALMHSLLHMMVACRCCQPTP